MRIVKRVVIVGLFIALVAIAAVKYYPEIVNYKEAFVTDTIENILVSDKPEYFNLTEDDFNSPLDTSEPHSVKLYADNYVITIPTPTEGIKTNFNNVAYDQNGYYYICSFLENTNPDKKYTKIKPKNENCTIQKFSVGDTKAVVYVVSFNENVTAYYESILNTNSIKYYDYTPVTVMSKLDTKLTKHSSLSEKDLNDIISISSNGEGYESRTNTFYRTFISKDLEAFYSEAVRLRETNGAGELYTLHGYQFYSYESGLSIGCIPLSVNKQLIIYNKE